jgi:signal transduction histidine kinase
VSLRLRLTLLNGLVLLLVMVAFAVVAYVTQARALETSLDTSLQQQAQWLTDNAGLWFDPRARRALGMRLPGQRVFASADVFVQVVGPDGVVQSRSANLHNATLPIDSKAVRDAIRGGSWFTTTDVDGQRVREYVAPLRLGEGGSAAGVIQVARPTAAIDQSLRALQASLLIVGAGGVLVSLIAGWLLARALQASFNRVEGALAAQRRFVADASHELRTPLTVVRGNLDLLALNATTCEHGSEPLADARAETERMGRLVSDLLLLAQADAGQHLTLSQVDLPAVLHDAFRAARFFRDDVELTLGDMPDNARIMGDADRLKQVLLILLDNALKYTPAGGRVSLSAQTVPNGGVALTVSDTGPGIPAAEREHIFERFARVDPTRRAGGSGLGLAIARWIVAEHRGTLRVDDAPGGGSTFSIWLPIRSVAAAVRGITEPHPPRRPAGRQA